MKTLKTIVAAPFMLIGFVLMTLGALVMYVIDAIGLLGDDDISCDDNCIADCEFCYRGSRT